MLTLGERTGAIHEDAGNFDDLVIGVAEEWTDGLDGV